MVMKNTLGRVINGMWMPPIQSDGDSLCHLQTFEGSRIPCTAIKAACLLKEWAEINTAHQMPEVSDYDDVYFL